MRCAINQISLVVSAPGVFEHTPRRSWSTTHRALLAASMCSRGARASQTLSNAWDMNGGFRRKKMGWTWKWWKREAEEVWKQIQNRIGNKQTSGRVWFFWKFSAHPCWIRGVSCYKKQNAKLNQEKRKIVYDPYGNKNSGKEFQSLW